jgi:tripartite-type tricarboxylate transporter receptor subunit TctC
MKETRWQVLVVLLGIGSGVVSAQDGSGEFYRDKTIRIVVGTSVGGGFDLYARMLARHLGQHIPGHPTIMVENMSGAGGLVAANHIYRVAKPDGLTVGHFTGDLLLLQVLERPGVEFDARRFQYVGAPSNQHIACAFSRASGITKVADWAAAASPVKMGGLVPGSGPDRVTRILKTALGFPTRVVTGYKGTADVRLAVEAGELAGACFNWVSMRAAWSTALESGDVRVVLQAAPKGHPDLLGIPLATDLARDAESRRLIELGIHWVDALVRLYTLPPGTPKDRVLALRRAFVATLKDPGFLAEAQKAKLEVDLVPGEEVERIVGDLFRLEPLMVAKLKTILLD